MKKIPYYFQKRSLGGSPNGIFIKGLVLEKVLYSLKNFISSIITLYLKINFYLTNCNYI